MVLRAYVRRRRNASPRKTQTPCCQPVRASRPAPPRDMQDTAATTQKGSRPCRPALRHTRRAPSSRPPDICRPDTGLTWDTRQEDAHRQTPGHEDTTTAGTPEGTRWTNEPQKTLERTSTENFVMNCFEQKSSTPPIYRRSGMRGHGGNTHHALNAMRNTATHAPAKRFISMCGMNT